MRKNTYDNQGVNYYLYYTPIINFKEKQHEYVFHFRNYRKSYSPCFNCWDPH